MSRIQESELIINSRGAIYHLDLRPEELAPTVIVVGDRWRESKTVVLFADPFIVAPAQQQIDRFGMTIRGVKIAEGIERQSKRIGLSV